MTTSHTASGQAGDLSLPIALAQLLEELERRPRGAHPGQYQAVAARLAEAIGAFDGETLEPLLRASPATAEVYENLHYAHAGLCRSNLDRALQAEILAKQAIQAAAQSPSNTSRP